MKNLSLEKFSPLKKEVIELIENCNKTILLIKNGKSLTGYELLKETAKTLQKKRKSVIDILAAERSVAVKYQKNVIAFEKELVGIIAPAEEKIEKTLEPIEIEKTKEKHKPFLADRIRKLKEIDIEAEEDFLLMMTPLKFDKYLEEMSQEYFDATEEIKRIEEIKKKAKQYAEKQAKIDKENAIQKEKDKAKKEKQEIIDANNAKEKARLDKEADDKRLNDERIQKEKDELEKKEKNKKYQKFLIDNGYTEETKDQFYITRNGNEFIIYKKLNKIIIN